MEGTISTKFRKCSNYATLTAVITNTITAMGRFKSVSRAEIISTVYNKLKERASK